MHPIHKLNLYNSRSFSFFNIFKFAASSLLDVANVLVKQSRSAEKGWSSSVGVRDFLWNNSHIWRPFFYLELSFFIEQRRKNLSLAKRSVISSLEYCLYILSLVTPEFGIYEIPEGIYENKLNFIHNLTKRWIRSLSYIYKQCVWE
jgi:hypothetical protein